MNCGQKNQALSSFLILFQRLIDENGILLCRFFIGKGVIEDEKSSHCNGERQRFTCSE